MKLIKKFIGIISITLQLPTKMVARKLQICKYAQFANLRNKKFADFRRQPLISVILYDISCGQL